MAILGLIALPSLMGYVWIQRGETWKAVLLGLRMVSLASLVGWAWWRIKKARSGRKHQDPLLIKEKVSRIAYEAELEVTAILSQHGTESRAKELLRNVASAYRFAGLLPRLQGPFGYRRVKVSDGVKKRPTLEVDPATAPVVREIFESSLRGNGLKEICKELNDRGITNRGKRWYKGGLHYLLTNEAYTGAAVWGRTSKGESDPDPVRVEGAWEALVPRELFDTVQQAMRDRAPAKRKPERAAALRGVRQALHRPGSQERPVRLLHLRHPVPGGRRHLRGPLPERPQGRRLRG